MYILCVFLLVTILYAAMVLLDHKYKQRKASKGDTEIMSLDVNRTEFYKNLNFLLLYGIITFDEYTKIELKSLPYLKG